MSNIDAYPLCWPSGWPRAARRRYWSYEKAIDLKRKEVAK